MRLVSIGGFFFNSLGRSGLLESPQRTIVTTKDGLIPPKMYFEANIIEL